MAFTISRGGEQWTLHLEGRRRVGDLVRGDDAAALESGALVAVDGNGAPLDLSSWLEPGESITLRPTSAPASAARPARPPPRSS